MINDTPKKTGIPRVLYTLGVMILVSVIGVWVFATYFAEDLLNDFLQTNLNQAVRTASDGRYRLTLGHIYYQNGTIFCKTFILERDAYKSDETGVTVERLYADTVWFGNVQWVALLRGNGLYMTRMEMTSPSLTMTEVKVGRDSIAHIRQHTSSISATMPIRLPVVSFDSIILHDIQIKVPLQCFIRQDQVYPGTLVHLFSFLLNDKSIKNKPLLYSKNIEFEMPGVRYDLADSVYSVEVEHIKGNLTDSIVTIDTISFKPNYSETAFSAREKFVRGRTEFRGFNTRVEGIDVFSLLSGRCISFHKCEVKKWSVDYYSDKRKPKNPHPSAAIMPNDLIRSFPFCFNIDTVVLREGKVRIKERVAGSSQAGSLSFDRARVTIHPLCTDSLSKFAGEPTRINLSAVFMGEASVSATIKYPIDHPKLDLHIDAAVGPCSIKILNPFLITNERKEVTQGMIESGALSMDIHNGVATTTVSPNYKDLYIKILPSSTNKKRGILETIKTFVANNFILNSTNIDKYDRKAKSATTTLSRKNEQELLQFIWVAVRKSLGKVIGGFE